MLADRLAAESATLDRIEHGVGRVREPGQLVEEMRKKGSFNAAQLEHDLDVLGSMTTEEVEHGRLIRDSVDGQQVPKGVAKGMTDREFSGIGEEFFINGVVVDADHELSEEGDGGTDAAFAANIVTAELAVASAFFLEAQGEQRLNSGPDWVARGLASQEGIVTRDHARSGAN